MLKKSLLVVIAVFCMGHDGFDEKKFYQEIYYKQKGQGDAVVVFIHGFPEFHYEWHQYQKLLTKNKIASIALDLPGFNHSLKPSDQDFYRPQSILIQLSDFLGHVSKEFKKIYLVGHDWGGIWAQLLAHTHPELIEKLFLFNTIHPLKMDELLSTSDVQQKMSQAYIPFYLGEDIKVVERQIAKNNFENWRKFILETPPFANVKAQKYLRSWYQVDAHTDMSTVTGGLQYYRAAFEMTEDKLQFKKSYLDEVHDIVQNKKIQVPTLFFWGTEDKYLMQQNHYLGEYIDDLSVELYPNYGHWIVHEDPKHFVEKIVLSIRQH